MQTRHTDRALLLAVNSWGRAVARILPERRGTGQKKGFFVEFRQRTNKNAGLAESYLGFIRVRENLEVAALLD
ncbi:hypothetical protein [Halopseudomonas maritima]|uniref:hypothetical protein n=1 Tax=Halopseudomonas maritima TaxID=2918528 RepID=UPI001EE9C368|nr:hypothetical protein [Halopseudomonas maritima]UJJ31473.1 hypothetical protein HV822_17290 [Halopseudomonas maritima]